MKSASTPTTARSLGALLKSARDIMRKDKGLNGDVDRLPAFGISSDVPPLQGGVDLVVTCSWAFSPSFHLTGFQPADRPGPKARHVTAWQPVEKKPKSDKKDFQIGANRD